MLTFTHSAFTLTHLCSHAHLSILTLMLVHAHMLTPVHIQFLPTVLSTLTHTHTHTHTGEHSCGDASASGVPRHSARPASGGGILSILVLLTPVCATEGRGR